MLIFMSKISGGGQGTMPTKPAPENVRIAGNKYGTSGRIREPTVADWYLRDVPLLTVDTKLWARWANETHSFYL